MITHNLNAQTIVPATSGSSIQLPNTVTTFADVEHISCDGLTFDHGNHSLKVFAWDAGNTTGTPGDQGWGFDYDNTSLVKTYDYDYTTSIGDNIYYPEIALVSYNDGTEIWALVAYNAFKTPGHEAFYEAYLWNGSTDFVLQGTFNSLGVTSAQNAVINIAGDRYGHFAIVWEEDGTPGGSQVLHQLTGYIDGSGALFPGTVGDFTYDPGTPQTIWHPDVDITYYLEDAPFDAQVFVTFATDDGSGNISVIAAATRMATLFYGVDWNSYTEQLEYQTAANPNVIDHPTIAVSDGYNAYNNSIIPRVGVTYRELDPSGAFIYAFAADGTHPNLEQPNDVGGNMAALLNEFPLIKLQPVEVSAVVAWNYDDLFSNNWSPNTYGQEGIARSYAFNNLYNPPVLTAQSANAMQIDDYNLNTITETAISGFSEEELLYFYYDGTNDNLYYKTRLWSATVLREQSDMQESEARLFPNPFKSSLTITLPSNDGIYQLRITDITGKSLFCLKGNTEKINSSMVDISAKILAGVYLIVLHNADGVNIYQDKLIKIN